VVGPAGVAAAGQIGILIGILLVAWVIKKIIGGRKAQPQKKALPARVATVAGTAVTPSPSPKKDSREAAPAAALALADATNKAKAKPAQSAELQQAKAGLKSTKAVAAAPTEEVEMNKGPPGGYKISSYEMQGKRKTMEDAKFELRSVAVGDVVGVLDGCGGSNAANQAKGSFERSLAAAAPGDALGTLTACFERAERSVLAKAQSNKWVDATTATVALVSNESLDVAWVGDSRAVLALQQEGKKLKAKAFTTDHRPENSSEKARVRALGGGCGRNEKEGKATDAQLKRAKVVGAHVVFNVNRKSRWRLFPGGITLTRALGGLPLKKAKPQLLVAAPEYSTRQLDGTEKFLIIACDGVWDTLSNDQAVACVDAALGSNPAEALVKKAFDAGSEDNITAAVIIFEKDEAVV